MTAVMAGVGALAEPVRMQTNSGRPAIHDPFTCFRSDHAYVLAQVEELERQTFGADAAPGGAALRDAASLVVCQFTRRMAGEDVALHPAIHAVFPAGRSTLESLQGDYGELRRILATLSERLDGPSSAESEEQLLVALRDCIDLLRLYIHREESALFDVALRVLSSHETEELGRRLVALASLRPPAGDEPEGPKGSQS